MDRTDVSWSTLYLEELKALMRARGAWWAAAAVLGLLTLAAVLLGPAANGVFAFSFFALGIVPIAFAPLAAAWLALPRATLLSHRLFTAPVSRAGHLAARVLALGTLGAAYVAATLPILLALGAEMGVGGIPDGARAWLLVGLGLVAYGVSFGLLLATLLPGSVAGPTALAGGTMVLSLLAGLLKGLFVDALGDGFAMRALHLLPHVALFDALAISPGAKGIVPASPAREGLAFLLLVLAMFGSALWAQLRAQGVDGWERPRARPAVALLLALVVATPLVVAAGEYEPAPQQPQGAPPTLAATLRAPGEPLGFRSVADEAFHEAPLVALDEWTAVDLVLVVPLRAGAQLERLEVAVEGGEGISARLTSGRSFDEPQGERVEWASGGMAYRIPMRVHATGKLGAGLNVYSLRVHATYDVEGAAPPVEGDARARLFAAGDGVATSLALAGMPALGLALVAGARRRKEVA